MCFAPFALFARAALYTESPRLQQTNHATKAKH